MNVLPVLSTNWTLRFRWIAWTAFWLVSVFVLLNLQACAGGAVSSATASQAVPVTESDEPEARKRARIRLELASSYFEQGQTTVALDETKQSLAADPTYPAAYVLRGLVFMRLNDPARAEESFRLALQLNPLDPDALHNYGWFTCQEKRYVEALDLFKRAMASPVYGGRAKTLMAQGICQTRMGQFSEAEASFARSFELDASNPISAYNLASLLYRRGEYARAQFHIRRLNNSEMANAETLWLGVKVERKLNNSQAEDQLAQQLSRRFPKSREYASYQRGAFDE